jgi:UDP-3-O-[3-hydroxymyristoyl] N-acetylglucosamine deacetylase
MTGRTVAEPVVLSGTGLHTGVSCTVEIRPAQSGTGIVFFRAGVRIPADAAHVVDTRRCTTLGSGGVRIATVEHLLASLVGLGITDAAIHVDGPEIPAMDGGGVVIVRALAGAGFTEQGEVRVAAIVRQGSLQAGRARYAWFPGDGLVLSVRVPLPAVLGGEQCFEWRAEPSSFINDIAPAKTFCLESEIAALRAAGLGLGGTEHTVLIIGEAGVVNPRARTFEDEFARHKVLDLLGDLALVGMPLRGRVEATAPGHAGNVELVRGLAAVCDVTVT